LYNGNYGVDYFEWEFTFNEAQTIAEDKQLLQKHKKLSNFLIWLSSYSISWGRQELGNLLTEKTNPNIEIAIRLFIEWVEPDDIESILAFRFSKLKGKEKIGGELIKQGLRADGNHKNPHYIGELLYAISDLKIIRQPVKKVPFKKRVILRNKKGNKPLFPN
jgi:hypothetical protein